TEFIQLEEFEVAEDENPDDILEATREQLAEKESKSSGSNDDADDLLNQLGL
ncbi:DUF3334 family protein, partial [Vibrio parahaemolyticus]|nr:DUF3334 family protein [Vibrio parahaemolyticus]